MEKKVSIVIPTFNCARFIAQTISSVLIQNYKNFEIIVIDDCSSDNTVDIISAINDSRIKIIQNKRNRGAAYCRNIGIENSSGEYIAFLDGDDLWAADKLSNQINFMEKHNYGFCYTDYQLIDENGQSLGIRYSGPNVVTHKMFLKIDYIGTSTVIYKRSIFPNLSIPDTIFKRNDDALWLTLSTKTHCYRLSGLYASYRRRSQSISSGKKSRLFKHHVLLYKKLYGFKTIKAFIYACRNVFYYLLKQIKYRKKISN